MNTNSHDTAEGKLIILHGTRMGARIDFPIIMVGMAGKVTTHFEVGEFPPQKVDYFPYPELDQLPGFLTCLPDARGTGDIIAEQLCYWEAYLGGKHVAGSSNMLPERCKMHLENTGFSAVFVTTNPKDIAPTVAKLRDAWMRGNRA